MGADSGAADALKRLVATAALEHVVAGGVLGVGSGSTVDCFIDALAAARIPLAGVVAASERSARRLSGHGYTVLDLNEVHDLPVYVDGADEVDPALALVKGGGAALTREKIVAAVASRFVCIVDARKQVDVLGRFPLPIEFVPIARQHLVRSLAVLGGRARVREGVVTDNGLPVMDVHGLRIDEPEVLEAQLDALAGVVTHGIFARRRADLLLVAGSDGVRTVGRAQEAGGT